MHLSTPSVAAHLQLYKNVFHRRLIDKNNDDICFIKTPTLHNMKKHFILATLGVLMAFTTFAQKNENEPIVLNVKEFSEKIKATPNAILLDVRTQEEYDEGHLKNSVLINVNGPDFKQKIKKLDKTQPVLVYCAAGVRSEKAATILLTEGFKNVYHLEGGIEQWKEEEKPVVKN